MPTPHPTLAAIGFSDPLMLTGLLAGLIPVVLHLLNRIRSPIVEFPTLRFLKIAAMKTSRRRQIQQWLLLFLRVALLALLAMTIAQPFVGSGNPTIAYALLLLFLLGAALTLLAILLLADFLSRDRSTHIAGSSPLKSAGRSTAVVPAALLVLALFALGISSFGLASNRFFTGTAGSFSGRSTACVIILDNSHSMLAREETTTRLQRAKDQLRALLSGPAAPAQVAILPTNPGESAIPDHLTSDTTALVGYVENLPTLGSARPMKQLLEQSAQLLSQTQLPHRLLLILSDFARPTFADVQLFSALKSPGKVPDLQVAFMPQSNSDTTPDLAIARFTLASGRPVVGSEVIFESRIINNSDVAAVSQLDLLMDDQPTAAHPRVQVSSSTNSQGSAVLKIPFRLPAAGPHRFTLRLQDQNDALAWDNQRELTLDVADQIKVLIVGAQDQIRPRSAAFYLNAALSPFAALAPGAPAWSIVPTYRSASRFGAERLDSYTAIFFCDVPRISQPIAEALSAYVQSGHRLIWFLGPNVSAADYNARLAGNLHLLSSPLASPLFSAKGSIVNWVDSTADIFSNLFDSEDPYRTIVVTGRWTFTAAPRLGRPIALLADEAPVITEHPLGRGEVFTVLTVPTADWSTLATTVPFLPMINRMALGTPAQSALPTSYETGQEVELPVPADARASAIDVLTPTGETINLPAPISLNAHWVFTHTLAEGLYRWQTIRDGNKSGTQGQFIVNPPAQEADLLMADTQLLAHDSSISHPTLIATTTADLLDQLNHQAQPTSLAPGILTLAALLLIAEALLANRHTPAHSAPHATLGVPPLGGVGEPTNAA